MRTTPTPTPSPPWSRTSGASSSYAPGSHHRGRPGKATGYSLHAVRAAERDLAAQAKTAYPTMVAAWQPTQPAARTAARNNGHVLTATADDDLEAGSRHSR